MPLSTVHSPVWWSEFWRPALATDYEADDAAIHAVVDTADGYALDVEPVLSTNLTVTLESGPMS